MFKWKKMYLEASGALTVSVAHNAKLVRENIALKQKLEDLGVNPAEVTKTAVRLDDIFTELTRK